MKTLVTSLVVLALVGCSSSDSGSDAAPGGATAGAGGTVGTAGTGGSTAGTGGSTAGTGGTGTGGSTAGAAGNTQGGGSGGAGGGTGLKMCDPVTDPAGLPTVNGTFVQFADAPAIMTTGGDPTGKWILEKSVTVLPKVAAGQVDIAKSSNVGTGYFEYGADKSFLSHTNFHVILEIGALGTQEQDTESLTKGTFAVDMDKLNITPECSSAGGQTKPPQFSVTGDKLTMVLFAKAQQGDLTIILESKRAP